MFFSIHSYIAMHLVARVKLLHTELEIFDLLMIKTYQNTIVMTEFLAFFFNSSSVCISCKPLSKLCKQWFSVQTMKNTHRLPHFTSRLVLKILQQLKFVHACMPVSHFNSCLF